MQQESQAQPRHLVGRKRTSLPPMLHASIVTLLVLVSLGAVIYLIYSGARDALRAEITSGILRTARIAATNIDPDLHRQFNTPESKASPEYQQAIRPLAQIMAADPQVAFVYTAILQQQRVYFILDATPMSDETAVGVMEEYEDPPPDLERALREQITVVSKEPYTDQWGTFISGYVPLLDSEGGFIGTVGIDLKIDDYESRLKPVRRAAIAGSLLGLVIALFSGLAVFIQRRSDRTARDLARQLRTVNALLDVSHALGTSVSLQDLLPVMIASTNEVMQAERTTLFVYDSRQRELSTRLGSGSSTRELRVPIDRGIVGRVARSGESAIVNDASGDPDFDADVDAQRAASARSVLAMPIRSESSQLLGVIEVVNRTDGQDFDADDQALLAALVAQIQVAFQRAHLTEAWVEKQKMDSSLKLAHSIQMGMLPTDFPTPGSALIELHAALVPARGVGGDFYDFFWLDVNRLCLVVADVSGKGIPAALFMAKAKTVIKASAAVISAPELILTRANEELSRDNDAAMFVTVFLGIYDCRNGELHYSNAGHNPPVRVRADHSHERLSGDGEGLALGIFAEANFSASRCQLSAGELVFFYTDGVNEAMDAQGREYGMERLEALLEQGPNNDPKAINTALLADVNAHAGGAEQSDDITLMALSVSAIGAAGIPEETASSAILTAVIESGGEDPENDPTQNSDTQSDGTTVTGKEAS